MITHGIYFSFIKLFCGSFTPHLTPIRIHSAFGKEKASYYSSNGKIQERLHITETYIKMQCLLGSVRYDKDLLNHKPLVFLHVFVILSQMVVSQFQPQ